MQFYGNAVPANSSGNSDSKSGGGSSSSQEDSLPADNGIENIGLAVFKGDKLIGKLTKTETLSNLVITNKLKSCRLSIPDPEDQSKAIDSYLTLDTKPEIKATIVNGTPYVKLKVKMNARISSINEISDYIPQEKIDKIEESASHYLKVHLLNYLYKTSKEFNSDISGIGKYAISNFKTRSEYEDYNWLDNFQNAFFDVETQVKIRSSFLLNGT